MPIKVYGDRVGAWLGEINLTTQNTPDAKFNDRFNLLATGESYRCIVGSAPVGSGNTINLAHWVRDHANDYLRNKEGTEAEMLAIRDTQPWINEWTITVDSANYTEGDLLDFVGYWDRRLPADEAIDQNARDAAAAVTLTVEEEIDSDWIFSDSDMSALVAKDVYSMLYRAPDSDTTGASGAYIRKYNGNVQMDWASGVDGNLQDALIACRQIGRIVPGATVEFGEGEWIRTVTTSSILLENVRIKGAGSNKTIFKQATNQTNKALIYYLDDTGHAVLEGITIDGNNLVIGNSLVYARGVKGFKNKDVKVINWDRAYNVKSSATQALVDAVLEDVEVTDASTVQNSYPMDFGADWGTPAAKNIRMTRVKGIGPEIPFTNSTTVGTGDFVSLKNVDGFYLDRVDIVGGGELGFSINYGSQNGVINECSAYKCDADGLGIGNGQVIITVADTSGFIESENVTFGNGATGVLDNVYDGKLYISGLSLIGSTVAISAGDTVTGDTSTTVQTITKRRFGAANIRVQGGAYNDNGIDALVTGSNLAGVKLNMAERIRLNDVDVSTVDDQEYGLYVVGTDGYLYRDLITEGVTNPVFETGSGNRPLSTDSICRRTESHEIIAGEITLLSTEPVVTVVLDTEGQTATDALTKINGGWTGQMVVLKTATSARDVTVNNTGFIRMAGAASFTLDNIYDRLLLQCADTDVFVNIAPADNL